ncbi:MAG: SAM-dependent methyltransferase [Polyangiaceae bacterium]
MTALRRNFVVSWLSGVTVSVLFGLWGCMQTQVAAPAASAPTSSAAAVVAAPTPAPPAESAPTAASFEALVAAPDRSEEDRALDAGRHPTELLALAGVRAGMHVAELGAGGGYTAELLARAVGPSGVVYGQNTKDLLERFAEKPWSTRLAKPVMKNVVRTDRNFDDPLPPEAKGLDAVFMVLFYHDTVWQNVDRPRMNQAIFQALKPGGLYVLLDHSSRPGAGLSEVKTLHRIEEPLLRAEIEQAGFRLVRQSDVWRVPSDSRDWSTSPRVVAAERRGTSDRFALVYARP